MNISKLATFAVLALACTAIGFLFARSKIRVEKLSKYVDGRTIPNEGLIVDPQGNGHPGDPLNAEKDFRKLYSAIVEFRRLHGRLPRPSELFNHKKELVPGYTILAEDLHTPDHKYADGKDVREKISRPTDYQLAYVAKRVNGEDKPAFPKAGERDVWLASHDYIRDGLVIYPDGRGGKYHHTGEYVVLFSDGNIERIPQSKTFMVKTGRGSYTLAMPGEAGLPKDAIPITQFWKSIHGDNVTWD